MRLRIFFLMIFFRTLTFAQDYNIGMQVYKTDLNQNTFAKDSTASALVIYDFGNAYVDKKSFRLKVEVKQKLKILKLDGKNRGEVEIKLYKGKSSKESVKNIRGATYNIENNEVIRSELSPDAIYKEENENYTLVKFVLPNVKVGSVITYRYETSSPFMNKYQPWYFQGEDPVLYSEYNTSIPGNYEYNIKLVGSIPLTVNDTSVDKNCLEVSRGGTAHCGVSRYVMENIPAYKQEDFTTTPLNYLSRIEYELSVFRGFDGVVDKISKTWKDVDKELKADTDFGKQLNKKSLVKNILPSSVTSMQDDSKKANAIYQFVLDNYKWNGKYSRFDVSVKDVLKSKSGSIFDINLLLYNFLKSENIAVYPVLLSTRSNGLITKLYPVLSEFNYVIIKAKIDNKDYYLDATNPYLAFGELPFVCLNQYGRLIDFEKGSYWEDIAVNKFSIRQHKVRLSLSEDGALSGTVDSKFDGYHAHNLKKSFNENASSYKANKANSLSDIIIDNHKILNFEKTNSAFEEHLEFNIEPEFIGNSIYLDPFIFKFFEENPFKLQERTYPIDFGYKDIYSYVSEISIPDSFKVIDVPKSVVNYALPNNSGTLLFSIQEKENKIVLYFKVKFDKAIYPKEYYQYLKEFMNKVLEIQKNSIIVLEKK